MAYSGFAVTNGSPNETSLKKSTFYSIGSEVYTFDNKSVQSIVGSKEADEFIENKETLYSFNVGFIPAGYEHRPDLISSVYYGT